jgi:hypothetical protein
MADYNKNFDELVEKQKREMEKTLKELNQSADKVNSDPTHSPNFAKVNTEPTSNHQKIIKGTVSDLGTKSDIILNSSRQNEILLKILETQDKQLETQEKQLYWIRLIGIPFLCSAVITAIYMIIYLIMKL